MYRKLIPLLKTQTAKDTMVTTVATGGGALLAAVFFILAARLLGPENFGIFSLATALSFMLADIFDIALNSSLVRFVAAEIEKTDGEEEKYLKLILKVKLAIGLGFILLSSIFAAPLSMIAFGKAMPQILSLTGLGTGLQLLYTFSLAHLQARKEFVKAGIGMVLLPLLRMLGILGLLLFLSLGTVSALVVYFFVIPLATIPLLFMAPTAFLKTKGDLKIARKLFGYNLPLTVGFALAAVAGRIDNFILGNLAGTASVGYYAAAFRLFAPVQYLAGSLATVLAPRFSTFQEDRTAKTYVKKAIVALGALTIGMLAFLPFSRLIIQLFYGSAYAPSVPVLRILFLGYAAFFFQAPFTAILLYYFAKTKLFAIIALVQLAIVVTANLILVPRLGESGSALAFLITQFLCLGILASYTVYRLRRS
ncbi:MAG: hypothetical protein A2900_03560 [Candidatus Chisholmbacteria bacterium RIFCSPLOWO2_01_FULL_50_28]|uniref:Polysaccharide biosynthesis protein C-terminal domain-containing protein n=1 Tax=Candidatus Chisholmbacteria bacterium RIFCSPHIGHO2_01_FULL_52_32 TaxID=1797591 RepID=A0A1G1VSU9_9BACT|nr:MAG: hypothetical protein A2786_03185 [Candidatus Chisholmbacteria bacterium RIFCSPHIGHO2_01_FULL_52_32]OGY20153.1 MAG: hypothetical protein A2900_03560 [Candidatus Chisholmbacteria bacterium RIFCSPLOWO2_01_FULL_50_28]